MSNLLSKSGQPSTVQAVDFACPNPEKTITIGAEKYAKLLRAYRKMAVAMKRRAADNQHDADLLIADLDLQLNDLAQLN